MGFENTAIVKGFEKVSEGIESIDSTAGRGSLWLLFIIISLWYLIGVVLINALNKNYFWLIASLIIWGIAEIINFFGGGYNE